MGFNRFVYRCNYLVFNVELFKTPEVCDTEISKRVGKILLKPLGKVFELFKPQEGLCIVIHNQVHLNSKRGPAQSPLDASQRELFLFLLLLFSFTGLSFTDLSHPLSKSNVRRHLSWHCSVLSRSCFANSSSGLTANS